MFAIRYTGLSFHSDLQLVQADVSLEIDGQKIIDEPLCIDVGLPSLMMTAFEDMTPDRFLNPAASWDQMPFFVCGCGDPECRAFSFAVRHDRDEIVWTELEETTTGVREIDEFRIPKALYRNVLQQLGEQFLRFVAPLDYRPLNAKTISLVREALDRLRA